MWLATDQSLLERPICAYIEQGVILALGVSRTPSPHTPSDQDIAVLERLSLQLGQYLAGTRQGFDLPVVLPETPWRTRVFNALASVPYGKTVSYAQLAEMAGNSSAARAAASALSSNPLPLLRPCHRVVPGTGHAVGKYRWGRATKKYLVELEARNA